jgi:hypothetical protein
MDEKDFDTLREHLKEVRPIIDRFCARHGFSHVNPVSIGRYPRIRIERAGTPAIWFDLWMGLDKDGCRFETFVRDRPYDLSAGAYLDQPDGLRYSKTLVCFSDTPFFEVASVLMQQMEQAVPVLEKWDSGYLIANGTKIKLDG